MTELMSSGYNNRTSGVGGRDGLRGTGNAAYTDKKTCETGGGGCHRHEFVPY